MKNSSRRILSRRAVVIGLAAQMQRPPMENLKCNE
jgi:hypothetical protein